VVLKIVYADKVQKPIRITNVYKVVFCRPYFAKYLLAAVKLISLITLVLCLLQISTVLK